MAIQLDAKDIKNNVLPTTSQLSLSDRWDHFLTRWGYRRNHHRVNPGIYKLGSPSEDSPIFVTANYTLSFDALRSSLKNIDGYILVLDTLGVNVWCAAGKGTFGTEELINRIKTTKLNKIVSHRRLILPQLGAPGIDPIKVKRATGFNVEYGPVRANDLPLYLETRQATPEMRRVRFNLMDRIVLIPIEIVHVFMPLVLSGIILYFLSGLISALAAISAILAGATLFPILVLVLPSRDFSSKGFILGGLLAIPFAILMFTVNNGVQWWIRFAGSLGILLAMPSVTAYLALNFTGSTTYTSKSGVKREMTKYIPLMAWMFGSGITLMVIHIAFSWILRGGYNG